MELKEQAVSQHLELKNREKFSVNGVTNVERFSPNEVLLKTSTGGIKICGSNFKLEDLSKQNGGIFITGKVDLISFENIREKRSFFKDLFR